MDEMSKIILWLALIVGFVLFKMCTAVNKVVPGRNPIEKFLNGARIGEQLANRLRR